MPRALVAGEVVKETKFTEHIAAAQVAGPSFDPSKDADGNKIPFYDFLEQHEKDPEVWKEMEIRCYRYTAGGGKPEPGPIFASTPMNIFDLKRQCGGGEFKFMMKYKSSLIYCEDHIIFSGPARDMDSQAPAAAANSSASSNGGGNNSGVSEIAREVVSLLREQLRNPGGSELIMDGARGAMKIQSEAFAGAANAIAAATHPATSTNPTMDRFMDAIIAKVLNPPPAPDPIETFVKMMDVMKGNGLAGGRHDGGSVTTALVQQIPGALAQIGGMVDSWRKIEETRLRGAIMMRGQLPAAPHVDNPAPPAGGAPQPVAVEQPAPQQSPQEASEMQLTIIENAIKNIVMDDISVGEAVDRAITTLDSIDPTIVDQLVRMGQAGLENIFNVRPILASIPKGPRLTEFIKKFIEEASKPADGAVAVKPN